MKTELFNIERTLLQAAKQYRNLLPYNSRKIKIENIDHKNALFQCFNENDFHNFRIEWETYLNFLDQIWNKLNAYNLHHGSVQNRPKVEGFLGTINQTRNTDELLVYLDKARNNSQHTLWLHLKESETFEVITDSKASVTKSPEKIVVTGSGDSAKVVSVLLRPGFIFLKEIEVVENKQKKVYNLPNFHLDKKISIMDRILPQMIGKMGYLFYSKVFSDFVTKI